MRLIRRTVEILRTEGVRSAANRVATYLAWQYVVYRDHLSFDWRYGTETMLNESAYLADVQSPFASSMSGYEPSNWREFSRIMKAIPADPRAYTFVDVGSGKGRVLFFADLLGYQRIVGIEFSEQMADAARRNIVRFRERRRSSSTIDVVCQDATTYEFPDGPIVLYLYNPFGPDMMRPMIEKVRRFVEHGQHDLYIAYRNQTCADLFDAQPFLTVVEKTRDHAIYRARRA